MKKIAALIVTGLLIANSFYGQQKTIQVLCKNRITVEETKYQSGKIVETTIKDYGYSAMNQQLLNFVDIRLSELNFLVSMKESDKCDYMT